MFKTETELVEDLILAYGREITLGELLDQLQEKEDIN